MCRQIKTTNNIKTEDIKKFTKKLGSQLYFLVVNYKHNKLIKVDTNTIRH